MTFFTYLSYLQDDILWACLAAMSAYAKDLNTAEVSYAAILEVFLSINVYFWDFHSSILIFWKFSNSCNT